MKTFSLLLLFSFLAAQDDITIENAKERVVVNVANVNWDDLKPKLTASNKVDSYSACITENHDGTERVFFKDNKNEIVYEITGFPLPKRFSSDLLFSEPGRLNFNRWHTPHFGWHYEIDCRLMTTVDVHTFGDRFFIMGDK